MGIDTLSFEPSDELNQPNRDITLSGWRDRSLSFDAKVYLGFIADVTEYEIGIGSRTEVTAGELMDMARDLEEWDFEDSGYNPSYENPSEPDSSVPKNNPNVMHSQYGRGPNSSKEVEDLAYLMKKYSEEGGKLVYYY